jgi:hypothetical protein
MQRLIGIFLALVASIVAFTAMASAQGLLPTIWRSDQGAILKILQADPASGRFTGIFISGPGGPCPGVPYALSGRVVGKRMVFRTTRNWTSDCRATTVWSGRLVGPATVSTYGVTTYFAPNGRVVRSSGTSVFQRI